MKRMEDYRYTQRMEQLFERANKKLKAFISREDVAQAREDVLSVQESARIWRMGDLESMCKPLGIDADALLKDASLLQQIPTQAELKERMAQAMYEMYRKFPTSVDYMERTVARLAPEYADDPLRVAILKKFLVGYTHNGTLFDTGRINEWIYAHLSDGERAQADALQGAARRRWLAERVTDDVFVNLDTALGPQRMLELMARRWRHCMEHPESCFMRQDDGSKAAVQDLALSEGTRAGLAAFWQAHMDGEAQPDSAIDCMERIVQACADGSAPKAALEMFYAPLEQDFYAQLSRMAYVNANAADSFGKIGREFAQKSAEQCLQKKYGVTTRAEHLERWFFALWEDHADALNGLAALTEEHRDALWATVVKRAEDACLNGPISTDCLEKSMRALAKKIGDLFVQSARKAVSRMNEPMRTRFKTDRKDALKRISKDWELLKIADDLAGGKLRKSSIMKVYLYYFAFMFGMKASLRPGDPVDPERDIDKNLFHDYYSDNIMRYLQQEFRDPAQITNLAKEPTGEGINYKNYAEAIYLYYLSRSDDGASPGERLDKANRMIAKCAALGAKHARSGNAAQFAGNTLLYRNSRMPVLLELSEAELPEYICRNYVIVQPNSGSRILVNSEEITATERVREIMQWLEEAFDGNSLIEQTTHIDPAGVRYVFYKQLDQSTYDSPEEKDANAVRWEKVKADSVFAKNMQFEWELSALLRQKFGKDEDFMRIVAALENRLDTTKNDGALAALYKNANDDAARVGERDYARLGAERIAAADAADDVPEDADAPEDAEDSRVRVTRSGMIALYANYYKTMLDDSDDITSFSDLYDDFCSVIDPLLEESRYQPISVRNILDVYVLFTLYFYMLRRDV